MAEANVDIDPERQKEIEALEAKITSTNFYEFLGVPSGASTEDVRNAFHALSRKFHPDRFFGKNLGSFKGRIDRVFQRLVEANQTLTDPEKLKAYLESNPFVRAAIKAAKPGGASAAEAPAERTADEASRDAERRARLARHPYLARSGKVSELMIRAKAHIAKSEFAHAFTQLNMAAQFDPANVEVKTMLVDVRKKTEEQRCAEDLKRAKEALSRGEDELALASFKSAANMKSAEGAYMAAAILERRGADPKESSSYAQKAVEAAPNNVDYRLMAGRLLEAAGMKAMAKKHYDEAVKLAPDHPDVKKHAKRRWPF